MGNGSYYRQAQPDLYDKPGKWGYGYKTYFSKQLPKGSISYTPDTYDYEAADLFDNIKSYALDQVAKQNRGEDFDSVEEQKKVIRPAQQKLLDLGYLDFQEEADGVWGPQTRGAMRRYHINRPSFTEEIWHKVKNIF